MPSLFLFSFVICLHVVCKVCQGTSQELWGCTASYLPNYFLPFHLPVHCAGGAVAQWAERTTPGQEIPGSIPAVATGSLLVGLALISCV